MGKENCECGRVPLYVPCDLITTTSYLLVNMTGMDFEMEENNSYLIKGMIFTNNPQTNIAFVFPEDADCSIVYTLISGTKITAINPWTPKTYRPHEEIELDESIEFSISISTRSKGKFHPVFFVGSYGREKYASVKHGSFLHYIKNKK